MVTESAKYSRILLLELNHFSSQFTHKLASSIVHSVNTPFRMILRSSRNYLPCSIAGSNKCIPAETATQTYDRILDWITTRKMESILYSISCLCVYSIESENPLLLTLRTSNYSEMMNASIPPTRQLDSSIPPFNTRDVDSWIDDGDIHIQTFWRWSHGHCRLRISCWIYTQTCLSDSVNVLKRHWKHGWSTRWCNETTQQLETEHGRNNHTRERILEPTRRVVKTNPQRLRSPLRVATNTK